MAMTLCNLNTAFVLAGLCIFFSPFISADSDHSSCLGPIQYYKERGCTPVTGSPESVCPKRYDCPPLALDKCYMNGHEYELGQRLTRADRNPCDIECRCIRSSDGTGHKFRCGFPNCETDTNPGCYRQQTSGNCCPGREICPATPEDRPTCIVDGTTYKDGQKFPVTSEPHKVCYCGPNYVGNNTAPFCYERKNRCDTMKRHTSKIRQNCVPIYSQNAILSKDCPLAFRCQKPSDAVVEKPSDAVVPATDMKCTFGNLEFNIGEELRRGVNNLEECVKCVCEVPPTLTCRRLSEEECRVTLA